MDDNLTHTSLGKYHLIASLGGGGMAKVYLALMAGPGGFNKLLVIKVLRDDVLSGSDESVHMFWDEARLAARLVHPNIVQTYEGGEIQGRYFLAMEYLDGQAYRAVQNRLGPRGLPLHEELRVLSETARGLHYSHELKGFQGESLGVVHRDISPQNVFLTYDGQVKLLDFGIAKTTDANHKTQIGVIKGKLDYIAPEQLRGDPLDRRADIFALGAMLWETVAGQRFAGGRRVREVTKVHSRVTGGEPRIQDVAPETPQALVDIIERAIALDPADRFQDAAAFADAIDAHIESMGHKPCAKNLSELLTQLFESERQAMYKLIEQQVHSRRNAVELGETTGELPRLGSQDTRSSSSVWPQGGRARGEQTSQAAYTAESAWAVHDAQGRRTSSRRVRILAAIGITTVLAGGLMIWLTPRPEPPAPPAAVAPVSTPAAPVTSVPPAAPPPEGRTHEQAPEVVQIEVVEVSPAGATISLDGTPVPVPFAGRFPKDGVLHRLEASAEGHRPYKRFINFDRNHALSVALERLPPSRRRHEEPAYEPRERAVPVSTPSPGRMPMPGGELQPPRQERPRGEIDTDDPYATTKRSIPAAR